MILSDIDPSRETLAAFHVDKSRIAIFDQKTFIAKSISDYKRAKYKLVYINLRREGAKEWCESQNLVGQTEYTILTLYKGVSDTSWLESLEGIAAKHVSMKLFAKIKTLTLEEFVNKVQNFKDISVPPNPGCCCSSIRGVSTS